MDASRPGSQPAVSAVGAALVSVLDLGAQALTGVFPRPPASRWRGPLELVWCRECRLLQLADSYEPREMYGDNYGYRSGLNQSMVAAPRAQGAQASRRSSASRRATPCSTSGATTARCSASYADRASRRIGIDPTARSSASTTPTASRSSPTSSPQRRSSASATSRRASSPRSRCSTTSRTRWSSPASRGVPRRRRHLALRAELHAVHAALNAYDTVCHEHLEYYSLATVERILDEAGLEIVDVRLNGVNGGSFAVTAAHAGRRSPPRAS